MRETAHKKAAGTASIGMPGTASLIIILAVLCIAIFAILTLSTVLADFRLAETSFGRTSAYYAADAAAEEQLAGLRSEGREGTVTFSVPVSDKEELEITALIEGDSCTVLRRQTVYTASWEADEFLDIWDDWEMWDGE